MNEPYNILMIAALVILNLSTLAAFIVMFLTNMVRGQEIAYGLRPDPDDEPSAGACRTKN